jgi:uncharacterized membrane protein SpoIIM required for sporulation
LPDIVVELWSRYEHLLWVLGITSIATLVISVLLVPYLIVVLPADFYSEGDSRHLFQGRPLMRMMFLLVKNALGALLLVAGVVMIFLPGQGILTILAGLALLNFPGKRKLELRFLHMPSVLSSINWLRVRAGRDPLSL